MKKLIFGIVCFRERFWECESFTSLMDSFTNSISLNEINIFIFDNTDLKGWHLEPPMFGRRIKLNYVHFNCNPGISFAYNHIAEFAKLNNFQWMVFLDQDSILPRNVYEIYEKFASKNSDGIAAPQVVTKDKLFSPSHYRNYRTEPITETIKHRLKLEKLTCINSGLMISVTSFFDSGGYNNDLRIDFCDHEFIERVSKKLQYLNLLDFKIHQNFSTDSNNRETAIFRYKMFLIDLKTYRKIHQNKLAIYVRVDFAHLLRLTYQYKTTAFLKVRYSLI